MYNVVLKILNVFFTLFQHFLKMSKWIRYIILEKKKLLLKSYRVTRYEQMEHKFRAC